MARLGALSGSIRKGSFNRKLARCAAAAAESHGAEVVAIDLADYPMPIYDADLEAEHGLPEEVRRLQGVLRDLDGLMVSSPEYNGSITPLLKNAIDWTSRRVPGERGPQPLRGKTAALMSASPGALGGVRGLAHLHAVLDGLGMLVIPGRVSLAGAGRAFDERGALVDEAVERRLTVLIERLIETTTRLAGE
jgi:NAD(P)H-dependent FMN reductase